MCFSKAFQMRFPDSVYVCRQYTCRRMENSWPITSYRDCICAQYACSGAHGNFTDAQHTRVIIPTVGIGAFFTPRKAICQELHRTCKSPRSSCCRGLLQSLRVYSHYCERKSSLEYVVRYSINWQLKYCKRH